MTDASLALVLHAHLPFVRHPEHERFLEEEWFYQAATESYIPLIWCFDRLRADGVEIAPLLDAILPLFELDSYVDDPVMMMAVVEGDTLDPAVEQAYRAVIDEAFALNGGKYFSYFQNTWLRHLLIPRQSLSLQGTVFSIQGNNDGPNFQRKD